MQEENKRYCDECGIELKEDIDFIILISNHWEVREWDTKERRTCYKCVKKIFPDLYKYFGWHKRGEY